MSSLEFRKKKVEEIGVAFDKTGLAPMIGRVLGFLLLAGPALSNILCHSGIFGRQQKLD